MTMFECSLSRTGSAEVKLYALYRWALPETGADDNGSAADGPVWPGGTTDWV